MTESSIPRKLYLLLNFCLHSHGGLTREETIVKTKETEWSRRFSDGPSPAAGGALKQQYARIRAQLSQSFSVASRMQVRVVTMPDMKAFKKFVRQWTVASKAVREIPDVIDEVNKIKELEIGKVKNSIVTVVKNAVTQQVTENVKNKIRDDIEKAINSVINDIATKIVEDLDAVVERVMTQCDREIGSAIEKVTDRTVIKYQEHVEEILLATEISEQLETAQTDFASLQLVSKTSTSEFDQESSGVADSDDSGEDDDSGEESE
jgi:predicted transcriptional regulator